jgi:hypothetical protein
LLNPNPVAYIKVQIWDEDAGNDDLLAEGLTGNAGQFGPFILNNTDGDEAGKLDVYIKFVADGLVVDVTNKNDALYAWRTTTNNDIADGSHAWNVSLPPITGPNEEALWIFKDLTDEWFWLLDNTSSGQPAQMIARWERGENSFFPCTDNSCFFPILPISGIFISDANVDSADTVRHEGAHWQMWEERGRSMWFNLQTDLASWQACVLSGHNFYEQTTPLCAYTEGWPSFIAVAADGDDTDTCYDWGRNVCAASHVDVEAVNRTNEAPDWPIGDDVEGRVTTALYDMVDAPPDGLDNGVDGRDTVQYTFNMVWETSNTKESAWSFWDDWYDSQPNFRHYAVQALWWNGLNFNYSVENTTPASINLKNEATVFDVCWYARDKESSLAELEWSLSKVGGSQCSHLTFNESEIIIDAGIGVGECIIGLSVNDGIHTAAGVTTLQFGPISPPGPYRTFLPLIVSEGVPPC